MENKGRYRVSFGDRPVEIGFNNSEAKSLVEFLFSDVPKQYNEKSPRAYYDVLFAGSKPMVSLWRDDAKLYFGSCKHALAYTLVNEVIFQCVVDSDKIHAFHAAALSYRNHGIFLPGKSGSGKSTLVAWLISHGFNYLTDELVFLTIKENTICPFTRPISLKPLAVSLLSKICTLDNTSSLVGKNGVMVPHRLLNSDFSPSTPPLSAIIFPRYEEGADVEILKLSAAQCCLKLYECYINARNIEDHGLKEISAISRKSNAYQITYSNLNALLDPLKSLLSSTL